MKRRSLLKASVATALTFPLMEIKVPAQAKVLGQANGTEILTISDGNLRLPLSFIYPDVSPNELQKLLQDSVIDGNFVEPGLNLTLMRNEKRTVLFDVGSGANFMPTAGKLFENLEAAGVEPSDVTDVVFTHGHPDHLWGILDDFDEVAFPEAKLHFPRKEYEFWMNDDTVNLMSDARKPFAVGAKNRLEIMGDQVELFDAGKEVLPNVEAFDTSGHTPGHTSFVVHGLGEPVMIIGDALTNHIVSFEKPDWPSGSDQDTEQGIKTRKQLLDRMVHEDMLLVGYHLPNEGIGRVEKSESGYRFIPT